jgi:hypothetical protein
MIKTNAITNFTKLALMVKIWTQIILEKNEKDTSYSLIDWLTD